jgi:hypothetical protein
MYYKHFEASAHGALANIPKRNEQLMKAAKERLATVADKKKAKRAHKKVASE